MKFRFMLIPVIALSLVDCTSMRLQYKTDVTTKDGKMSVYTYEKSYSTAASAVACTLTAFVYGGWCWTYLGKPFDFEALPLAEDAQRDLRENQKLTDFKIGRERIERVSWDAGSPVSSLVPLKSSISQK
jgi:hypothetical protein